MFSRAPVVIQRLVSDVQILFIHCQEASAFAAAATRALTTAPSHYTLAACAAVACAAGAAAAAPTAPAAAAALARAHETVAGFCVACRARHPPLPPWPCKHITATGALVAGGNADELQQNLDRGVSGAQEVLISSTTPRVLGKIRCPVSPLLFAPQLPVEVARAYYASPESSSRPEQGLDWSVSTASVVIDALPQAARLTPAPPPPPLPALALGLRPGGGRCARGEEERRKHEPLASVTLGDISTLSYGTLDEVSPTYQDLSALSADDVYCPADIQTVLAAAHVTIQPRPPPPGLTPLLDAVAASLAPAPALPPAPAPAPEVVAEVVAAAATACAWNSADFIEIYEGLVSANTLEVALDALRVVTEVFSEWPAEEGPAEQGVGMQGWFLENKDRLVAAESAFLLATGRRIRLNGRSIDETLQICG